MWSELTRRPAFDFDYLTNNVRQILQRVKSQGDKALLAFSQEFDKVSLQSLRVSPNEIEEAVAAVSLTLKQAISTASHNIEKFHAAQARPTLEVETMPGVRCWRKSVAIERVGIYIPGGSAPLFSTVLMLALPAKLAGCREIILCSPPQPDGRIHPAIVYAAHLAGVTHMYKVGGAQAIGALAYGTESVPRVYKIFGPGNQYVTKAKQLVSEEGVSIDMPAGPSEVLVMADDSADVRFVAADLLSQAEHGPDSQVILLCTREAQIAAVLSEIEEQLALLPRAGIARKALTQSVAVAFDSRDDMIAFANAYAPEHLIIQMQDDETMAEKVINAGSVFLGPYTPESAGDYASGTNHTLPTNGFATAFSGVSLESFMKQITFQKITPAGIKNLGPVIEEMAAAEQLMGHKNAISVRLQSLT